MSDLTKLHGITTALATPLTEAGQVDEPAVARLVDFVLGGGINNLFVLGAAGEYATFSRPVRRRVIELVAEANGGRAPLIVGVSDNSTSLVLDHIADAGERGADFVLCTPPNFYPLTQDEMKDFYLRVSEEGGVPVIAYNCPLSSNHLEPTTVVDLADHPQFVGLKETSTQTNLEQMFLAVGERDDFVLMSGWEYLYLPALAMGIRAVIMGGPGNLIPRWCRQIWDEFGQGRHEEARTSFLRMLKLLEQLYQIGTTPMAAVKAGMELMGICQRHMSHPVRSITDDEKDRIESLLESFEVL